MSSRTQKVKPDLVTKVTKYLLQDICTVLRFNIRDYQRINDKSVYGEYKTFIYELISKPVFMKYLLRILKHLIKSYFYYLATKDITALTKNVFFDKLQQLPSRDKEFLIPREIKEYIHQWTVRRLLRRIFGTRGMYSFDYDNILYGLSLTVNYIMSYVQKLVPGKTPAEVNTMLMNSCTLKETIAIEIFTNWQNIQQIPLVTSSKLFDAVDYDMLVLTQQISVFLKTLPKNIGNNFAKLKITNGKNLPNILNRSWCIELYRQVQALINTLAAH